MRRLALFIPLILFVVLAQFFKADNNPVFASNNLVDSVVVTPWYIKLIHDSELEPKALAEAYSGYLRLQREQLVKNDTLLTIIDFTKPSNEERFFIIDIKNGELVTKSLVAHGKNSGIIYADKFSNERYSNKSSLGLFVTGKTYHGKHGYSLRILGQDKSLNDNVWERAVVVHGANYVNQAYIKANGRIGRSFGCPAIPYEISDEVIDLIKEGVCLFAYHPQIYTTSQYQQEIAY